jgi:hypothetical protein
MYLERKNLNGINGKGASLVSQTIIHVILIAIIFALFFGAAYLRLNSDAIKQQILQKQIALMIDSSASNTSLILQKSNLNGVVWKMEIKDGSVFVYMKSQTYSRGYPFFTKYSVSVEQTKDNFVIKIT